SLKKTAALSSRTARLWNGANTVAKGRTQQHRLGLCKTEIARCNSLVSRENKAMIREADTAAEVRNIERKFSGWEVAQAIECCADPDLLSACVATDRDWKDAGSPSRFSFLSEYL